MAASRRGWARLWRWRRIRCRCLQDRREHDADRAFTSAHLGRALLVRDRLASAAPHVFLLHLDGSAELIAARLTARQGHFMPPELLRTQFADMEPLRDDEAGEAIPIDCTPQETAALARAAVTSA